ncbi:hypothetical protein B0H14DRAFT_3465645 [Mycena olivaceomarginata]|nr:hypothetical protein B0H14DRAFT_3465645 [Mycena olivaceomarginata]
MRKRHVNLPGVPLVLPDTAPPLAQNLRPFAVRLLMRYAYVVGDMPTSFLDMKSAMQTERMLHTTDLKKTVALFCVNDDLQVSGLHAADAVLHKWFHAGGPNRWRVRHDHDAPDFSLLQ